jgi:hypothetical protein
MRTAIAALGLLLLIGVTQAQLRAPSLSDTNNKARKAFAKQNEKTRQAIVIPEKPSNLRPAATAHPTAARDALETACKKAAAESKMVFLRMGAPPCGGCVAFDHYHDLKDVSDILTKYYVILDIDPVFMPDGRATFSKYAEIGFPAWVILTPQKRSSLTPRISCQTRPDRSGTRGFLSGTKRWPTMSPHSARRRQPSPRQNCGGWACRFKRRQT